jgi:hypothetical protein
MMRTIPNFSNIIIRTAILAALVMGNLRSSFAQGYVKAQSFDQNNLEIMGSSTESLPHLFYYNSLILMEEKYNTFSVSSNFAEDNTLGKSSIKTSRSNTDDLAEYLLWASGLKKAANYSYESPAQNNSEENCQELENFLISAAHLHEYEIEDVANNEANANSVTNTENSLEQFLIRAAGLNEPVAIYEEINSEESKLEQFLINASHVKENIHLIENGQDEPDAISPESDLEQFLIKAAQIHDSAPVEK